jgi:hypothetical protein
VGNVPTEPLDSILYRDLSKVEAKLVVEVASPLLQELVNYGSNGLVRCAQSASGGQDEDLAILALYRHIVEMADGVEVLISQACSTPAIPLVRSSFEALLFIEYVVDQPQEYARRSLSWLVGYVHQRLDMYYRLDSTTPNGEQFRALLHEDEAVSRIRLPRLDELKGAEANLEALLAKPHITPIEAEYNHCGPRPRWHALFGGPPTLRALAKHLNRGAQYEMLYRYWSRIAHAQDALALIAIGRLRDPRELVGIATFASTFLLAATRHVLARLRPGEDLGPWYLREVRPYLSRLGRLQ